jgi:hypothetical protein
MENPFLRTHISNLIVIASLALAPAALAVDPPPDGGYSNQNTAEGEDALFSLTDGSNNTAIGYRAMYSDTRGFANTAVGFSALYSNALGAANTAVGYNALYSNTTGFGNSGIGKLALGGNTSGAGNTAVGRGRPWRQYLRQHQHGDRRWCAIAKQRR